MQNNQWRPAASLPRLRQRAAIIATIRQFFCQRQVLEVETPVLASYSVTDPYMEVLSAEHPLGGQGCSYLQSSPEYAMKRLLAADSGAIYQIAKAFRKGEQGSRHNPEFTMLEWYRPGYDHFQLMAEVEALVAQVIGSDQTFQRLSYRQLFQQQLGVDPHVIDASELQRLARDRLDIQMQSNDRDDWLNLLLAELIEPALAGPVFIYNYPASQAALARVIVDDSGALVAQRFELYVDGVELANGYFELSDAIELRQRLQHEQQQRDNFGKSKMAIDRYLMAAMESGLPSCAGVALGLDRLVMLALGATAISEVLAFPVDRA